MLGAFFSFRFQCCSNLGQINVTDQAQLWPWVGRDRVSCSQSPIARSTDFPEMRDLQGGKWKCWDPGPPACRHSLDFPKGGFHEGILLLAVNPPRCTQAVSSCQWLRMHLWPAGAG